MNKYFTQYVNLRLLNLKFLDQNVAQYQLVLNGEPDANQERRVHDATLLSTVPITVDGDTIGLLLTWVAKSPEA